MKIDKSALIAGGGIFLGLGMMRDSDLFRATSMVIFILAIAIRDS